MASKIIQESEKFHSLSEEILTFNCGSISNKNFINCRLSELNTLNYSLFTKPENDCIMLLINRLCTSIQPSDSLLVDNFCQLITNLIKCGINISGRTYLTCKKWILQVLEFAETQIRSSILIAFQNIINIGSFDTIKQDLQNLLVNDGLLRQLALRIDSDLLEINLQSVNCIEAFLANRERSDTAIRESCVASIKEIAINLLSTCQTNDQNRVNCSKLMVTCLQIVRHLINDNLLQSDPNATSEILGIIQVYLFHGIKGYSTLKPKSIRPALMDVPERIVVPPRSRNFQSKSRLKKGKKDCSDAAARSNDQEAKKCTKYTSDSDISDSESTSVTYLELKIRLEAIYLLNTIINELPSRDMFSYWSQIIVNATTPRSRVLTWLILKEPVSKLRKNALNTLADAILGARIFLAYAEESENSAFRTFFGTVSAMIHELHSILALVLEAEKNLTVLTHTLKCITVVIQTTPYARLKPGLIGKLARDCRSYILHKDPTTRVAALAVFEALASTDKITSEIIAILSIECQATMEANNPDNDANNEAITSKNRDTYKSMALLLQHCIQNISDATMQVPVKLQSLKLLSALINHDTGHLVVEHLEMVTKHVMNASNENDCHVAFHSCRVIEKMSSYLEKIHDQCTGGSVTFWSIVFPTITLLAQSESVNLREVSCDCLGTISNGIFTQFPLDRQILIITTLFGATRDEESAVRAAGLRSLGMLVTLPGLEENTGFVVDLADIVCIALNDSNLGVRIKAAWALANLSDCLSRQMNNNDTEPLPMERLLPGLYRASLKAAQDSNKVKCNALRAVGNILYLLQDFEISTDTVLGLDVLISCATTGNDMKVRWNACHAIGIVISSKPDTILPPNWKDKIFPALCELICLSPNFKVRTNAAWALMVCNSYGKYVAFLWKNIVLALDNSQHVPNFIEYSHRDALIQQLCLALGHVAAHTSLSDLLPLWLEIKDHVEEISMYMKQFQERVLPEKTDDFVKAKSQLNNYTQCAPTAAERQIARTLTNLLEPTSYS